MVKMSPFRANALSLIGFLSLILRLVGAVGALVGLGFMLRGPGSLPYRIGVGLGFFLCAGIVHAISYALQDLQFRIQQSRRQRTFDERGAAGETRRHILYLHGYSVSTNLTVPRPDALGSFMRWEREYAGMKVPTFKLETWLTNVVDPIGELIALRDPSSSLYPGAYKLETRDDEWRDGVRKLTASAHAIVVVPSSSPGVLWELKWIVDSGLLGKTIFIAPPTSDDQGVHREWHDTMQACLDMGLVLPGHDPRGLLFTMGPDGRTSKCLPMPTEEAACRALVLDLLALDPDDGHLATEASPNDPGDEESAAEVNDDIVVVDRVCEFCGPWEERILGFVLEDQELEEYRRANGVPCPRCKRFPTGALEARFSGGVRDYLQTNMDEICEAKIKESRSITIVLVSVIALGIALLTIFVTEEWPYLLPVIGLAASWYGIRSLRETSLEYRRGAQLAKTLTEREIEIALCMMFHESRAQSIDIEPAPGDLGDLIVWLYREHGATTRGSTSVDPARVGAPRWRRVAKWSALGVMALLVAGWAVSASFWLFASSSYYDETTALALEVPRPTEGTLSPDESREHDERLIRIYRDLVEVSRSYGIPLTKKPMFIMDRSRGAPFFLREHAALLAHYTIGVSHGFAFHEPDERHSLCWRNDEDDPCDRVVSERLRRYFDFRRRSHHQHFVRMIDSLPVASPDVGRFRGLASDRAECRVSAWGRSEAGEWEAQEVPRRLAAAAGDEEIILVLFRTASPLRMSGPAGDRGVEPSLSTEAEVWRLPGRELLGHARFEGGSLRTWLEDVVIRDQCRPRPVP